ncbi:unnamed protein product [Albugo candida]|nr:unnamed protein product [Albugo candida]|eukprot:CCI42066.1 unnamed protein product [Albugo candida]
MLPIGCEPPDDHIMNDIIVSEERLPGNDTDIVQIASRLSSARFDQIDSYEIDESSYKELPLIAQRLVSTGCFEGRMIDTKPARSRKRSHENLVVVDLPKPKEKKSLNQTAHGSKSEKSKIPDDDDTVVKCNSRSLFTPESKVTAMLGRYSAVLENMLAEFGIKRNEIGYLVKMDSFIPTHIDDAKVKVICQTIRLLEKHNMISKVDGNMIRCILSLLDRHVLFGFRQSASNDTKCDDAERKRTKIKRPLLQLSYNTLEIGTCILFLVSSSHSDRGILSEDIIDNCVQLLCQTIKNLQDYLSAASTSESIPHEDNQNFRRMIPELCDYMNQFSHLVESLKLSDCLILRLSSSLFDTFVFDSSHHVAQIQQSSIMILRSIYIQHPSHRKLLLDEALSTMLKVPLMKRNVRTVKLLYSDNMIQMITALVVTLLQCSDLGNRDVEEKSHQSGLGMSIDEPDPSMKHVTNTLDNIKLFSRDLIKNCMKKSEDRDQRIRLELFLEDLLTMFIYPEWFGAEMLLELLSSILAGILHGQLSKDEKRLDSHYGLMALSMIGKMCTSIKAHEKQAAKENAINYDYLRVLVTEEASIAPTSIRPKVIDASEISPNLLLEMVTLIHLHQKSKTNVFHLDSGRLLSAKLWQNALTVASGDSHEPTVMWFRHSFNALCKTKESQLDPLVISSDISARVSMHAALTRGFCQSFDKILSHMMALLAGGIATFRSRVMKVLSELVHLDPMLMARENVRGAVYNCFVDASISVRQAAVDLVGHYVAFHSTLFEQYFDMLSERLLDKGISVRKSVCKIFRRYLTTTPELDKEMDASLMRRETNRKNGCMRMLAQRIGDAAEETSIKKFILNTFQELWFGNADDWELQEQLPVALTIPETSSNRNVAPGMEDSIVASEENRVKQSQDCVTPSRVIHQNRLKLYDSVNIAAIIIEIIQHCNDIDWFASLLKRLLCVGKAYNQYSEVSSNTFRSKLSMGIEDKIEKIVKQLIDCLLNLEEGKFIQGCSVEDFQSQFLSCLRVLLAICEANPALLRNHLELLMVYINGDDRFSKQIETKIQTIALNIVGMVVSSTGTAPKRLIESLQRDLKDLIFKAPPSVVDLAIKCYTALMSASEKSSVVLREVLNTFVTYLIKHQSLSSYYNMKLATRSSLQRALYSMGQIAAAYTKKSEILDSNGGPNMENLLQLYLVFLKKPGDEACVCKALHGVKYLIRQQPEFLLCIQQEGLLGSLLTDFGKEVSIQCLLLFNDILQYEENRQLEYQTATMVKRSKSKEQVGGDQEGRASLIGSVAQAQFHNILNLCTSTQIRIRTQAVGCVSTLLNQGLVSPMHCVSALVTLEADQVHSVQEIAHAQLVSLHDRYPTLLCAPSIQGICESFDFQLRAFGQASVTRQIKDGQDVCVYGRLYQDCFQSNRVARNMFLSSVINQFSEKGKAVSPKISADIQSTLYYYSYLVEILASLPYEKEDEPLHLVHLINRFVSLKLSITLEDIAHGFIKLGVMKVSNGDTLDTYPIRPMDIQTGEIATATIPIELETKCCKALVASLLVYLKNHLKSLYTLSDEMCQLYSPVSASKAAVQSVAIAAKSLKLHLPSIDELVSASNPVVRSWNLFASARNTARDDQNQLDFDTKPVSAVRNRRRRLEKSQKEEREMITSVHDIHLLATRIAPKSFLCGVCEASRKGKYEKKQSTVKPLQEATSRPISAADPREIKIKSFSVMRGIRYRQPRQQEDVLRDDKMMIDVV